MGPGDALPVAMTVDAMGNLFAPNENYLLQPTGGLVHVIDAAAVTPADRARQQQLLTGFTKTRPQWLDGGYHAPPRPSCLEDRLPNNLVHVRLYMYSPPLPSHVLLHILIRACPTMLRRMWAS